MRVNTEPAESQEEAREEILGGSEGTLGMGETGLDRRNTLL